MSTRNLTRAIQDLFSQISKLAKQLTKNVINWLFRGLLTIGRRPTLSRAGFVLPTTVLLLLIVTLTVGSITLRTFTRTNQAIGERQQRVVYNVATPAIDRARSKLEYLFDSTRDPRFPGGVPGEETLLGMMLNDGRTLPSGIAISTYRPNGYDPYTFPDELTSGGRLDLNNDGAVDNAWRYRADTDGDGTMDAWVAYSIVFQTETPAQMRDTTAAATLRRANSLRVRSGPLSNTSQVNPACQVGTAAALPEGGWYPDSNTSVLRKNFQVNAYVLPDNPSGTVSTIEFQQDRQVNRGNKWGAWFRNDLEIFPGPQFNWNGAMHTEGSFIVGNTSFTGYLISSAASCLYSREASEITVANITNSTGGANAIPAFEGQVISGRTNNNAFGDNSTFHLHGTPPTTGGNDTRLDNGRDSVLNTNPGPADISLDPVVLLTRDISQSRGVNGGNPSIRRDAANWNPDRPFVKQGRIYNQSETAPYVDDSYRADNRYGPKPRYGGKSIADYTGGSSQIGRPIASTLNDLVGNDPAAGADATSLGLDGYWERRARREGMRLIVGQRLELGNPYGWGGVDAQGATRSPDKEPLLPWDRCTTNNSGRCHEARQRRTLRDNLAAVQATAVYHSANPVSTTSDGDIPLACLATTVHPATPATLIRSTTFENINPGGEGSLDTTRFPLLITDFFSGRGTNGWEYEPPTAASLQNINSPMMLALRNLAYYAGDPRGGSPSFQPVQDTQVHPYPSMAMFGDFSHLRRVFSEYLDNGVTYNNLSPADKTTLQTAACSMGMLAYNLGVMSNYDYSPPNNNLNELALRLKNLAGEQPGNTRGVTVDPNSSAEDFIDGLRRWRDQMPGAQQGSFDELIAMAQIIMTKEELERDRNNGFFGIEQQVGGTGTRPTGVYSAKCQAWKAGQSGGVNGGQIDGLKYLCSDRPRFPMIYSIFPVADHGEVNLFSRDPVSSDVGGAYINTVNGGVTYKAIDINNPTIINQIALKPRTLAQWVLPYEAAGNGTTPNNNRDSLIKVCVTTTCASSSISAPLIRIPFKDTSLFNGREMMTSRVMNMNIDLMRRSAYQGNFWLPQSGIIYAFREDGAREGATVRPTRGTWAACGNNNSIQTDVNCRMDASPNAFASYDPPLDSSNGISPKPVDYFADPDRRPHGFRVRRGSQVGRTGDEGRGLSLISDNPVYIQGDFNLHQTTAGVRLEEFRTLLPANGNYNLAQFYNRNDLDSRFARPTTDLWRPSEILADAITIISDNFCDGSIQDAITTAGSTNPTIPAAIGADYGCTGNGNRTSYLNMNRPTVNPTAVNTQNWQRENPFDTTSPISISRNGNPNLPNGFEYGSGGNTQTYYTFSDNKPLIQEATQRVNAIIISGLVPSRPNQAYGGLHNFPRFISDWNRLYISGSFLQLNFSNYGTGPFDQDAWEPGSSPAAAELIRYYTPPERLWGYDVGLQYAPAGPVAQRFVTSQAIRSEFYNEPPADDPYISNLCRKVAPTPNTQCF